MRSILLAVSFSLLAVPSAFAIQCLNGQSDSILTVEDWSLSEAPAENGEKTITITLQPQADLGIRLIDGTIRFEDVLGERIGDFVIERARGIPADAPYTHTERVLGTVLERLERLHPDDIATIACVRALVYEDGTLAEFRN